jgi:hypothetical protein
MASYQHSQGSSTSYAEALTNNNATSKTLFHSSKLKFQNLTHTTLNVDTEAFPAKKADCSLFWDPEQKAIEISLREFNNSLLLFERVNYQGTHLTRRYNYKDYPSFINSYISVPKFHLDITMSQEERDAFMDDLSIIIENCKLSTLNRAIEMKRKAVENYRFHCEYNTIVKRLLISLLHTACEMPISNAFQDEYAEQCIAECGHIHFQLDAATNKVR